jgi:hypothetical protein
MIPKEAKVDDPFTPEDIAKLSAEIDAELRELGAPGTGLARGRTPTQALAEKQKRAIEQTTGVEATTFLTRFKNAARKDLCDKGGILHTQWTKWRDLANKDIVKTFGGILVGMGLSGSALQIAVVAIAVYVIYLGVEAFCREV